MDVPEFWEWCFGWGSREDELGTMTKRVGTSERDVNTLMELCSFWLVELCTMWKVLL
jgi:hypothetical protein